MKVNIRNPLIALMLAMGVFFIPAPAFAQSAADTIPPLIHAELAGDALCIEASDEGSGVDAVWVNGERVGYPVTSPLVLETEDYAQSTDPVISIYAMDLAGNRSGVIDIENPFYQGSSSASASADPEQTNPLTPDGQATVVDYADDGDGKEFFTFTTPDEHIFYLVIDRQRDTDNVYFLNTVTESDLLALAEKNQEAVSEPGTSMPEIPLCTCLEKCVPGQVDVGCMVCKNDLKSCLGKEKEEPDSQEDNPAQTSKNIGAGTLVFILLAAVVAGGAGYYLKIYKPKHDLDDAEDLDELLGDDEAEGNEEEIGGTEINEDAIEDEEMKKEGLQSKEPKADRVETNGEKLMGTEQEKANSSTVQPVRGETMGNTASYDDYDSPENDEESTSYGDYSGNDGEPTSYDDYLGNDEPEEYPDGESAVYTGDEAEWEE